MTKNKKGRPSEAKPFIKPAILSFFILALIITISTVLFWQKNTANGQLTSLEGIQLSLNNVEEELNSLEKETAEIDLLMSEIAQEKMFSYE